jgi:hypothetical protein
VNKIQKIEKMLLLAPGAVHGKLPGGTGSTILAFKNQKIKSKVLGLFFCVSRSHTELDLPFTEVYRYV